MALLARRTAVAVAPKARCVPALPAFRPARLVNVKAQLKEAEAANVEVNKLVAVATAATTFLASGNAMAATELTQLAASDNRVGILATLFLPVLGWVAFNIAGPAFSQLDIMGDKAAEATPDKRSLKVKRSIVGPALGLGAASLLTAGSAEAATELSQLAASDNRLGILATLFLPVLGWVAFNIAGPAFSQLDIMGDKAAEATPDKRSLKVKRSIVGPALGLGAASLLAAGSAEAATELSQLAASDNRVGILATLFLPVLGWVAFNIAGPAFSQLDIMGDKAAEATPDKRSLKVKRSIVGPALGLGAASLLAAGSAEAATELSQLAASDNRLGILATLFLPVLGWVAFNIAGPAFSQLDIMGDKAAEATPDKRSLKVKRSIVGPALGLGAASLLAAGSAEAATELSQLAASDNRLGILATLFLPVLGWVAFNIAGPAFSQLDIMGDKAAEATPDKRSLKVNSKRK